MMMVQMREIQHDAAKVNHLSVLSKQYMQNLFTIHFFLRNGVIIWETEARKHALWHVTL